MKLLITLLLILTTTTAWGSGPFMISDPNPGAEEYVLDCQSASFTNVSQAREDGSVYWDFATWTGGPGWHDCTIRARATYAVEDKVAGVTTDVVRESDPVNVRIKIAPPQSSANHKIQE